MQDEPQADQSSQDLLLAATSPTWRTIAAYSIAVGFIGVCGYYFYAHRQDFAFLADVSLPHLVAAGLCIVTALAAGMFQLKPFFDHYQLSVRFLELGALTTTSSLGNFVLPMRGGTAALAFYLKRIHGMGLGEFSLTYAGIGLLTALTNSGLALIGLTALFLDKGFFQLHITVLAGGLFGFCLILILCPPQLMSDRAGFRGRIGGLLKAWHALTSDRLLLAKTSAALVIVLFCITGCFYFLYRALGVPLPFFAVLVTLSVGNIATLVPITPGALGIFDVVTIQIPLLFGLDVARSITATVLFRALFLLWAFGLGMPGFFYLSKLIRRGRVGAELRPNNLNNADGKTENSSGPR
jgi:uncharacterized membrane protein YbhN (UPF0104 family)